MVETVPLTATWDWPVPVAAVAELPLSVLPLDCNPTDVRPVLLLPVETPLSLPEDDAGTPVVVLVDSRGHPPASQNTVAANAKYEPIRRLMYAFPVPPAGPGWPRPALQVIIPSGHKLLIRLFAARILTTPARVSALLARSSACVNATRSFYPGCWHW